MRAPSSATSSTGSRWRRSTSLPDPVIEFIRTHHGRSTTRYFYNSYSNEHPDEVVDPEPFTYPGPNPYTKEQGILMLADSVEAASRSLGEYTEEASVVSSLRSSMVLCPKGC